MSLGYNLFQARKKSGYSQEEVAEKLGVSRQTISKWETDETLPDIRQSKHLSVLYHVSLDELIDYDIEVNTLKEVIQHTKEETVQKVDWTKLWAEKYPILQTYQKEVNIDIYKGALKELIQKLQKDYQYHHLDAFLVLKDILASIWNQK